MVVTWLHRGCGVRAKLEELDWNECVFTSLQACKMCLNEASSINGIRFFFLSLLVGSTIMVFGSSSFYHLTDEGHHF